MASTRNLEVAGCLEIAITAFDDHAAVVQLCGELDRPTAELVTDMSK